MHRFQGTTIAILTACLSACRPDPPPPARAPEPVEAALPGTEHGALLSRLPEPATYTFDAAKASELIRLSLDCVDREYPNKPGNVVDGDETVKPPRRLHPAFHGCFDWHSAVHGHWAMVRILRSFPDIEEAEAIRAALDRHITGENIAGELLAFEGEHGSLFERPYGWGWLMRLSAELETWDDPDASRWAGTLAPLTQLLSLRTREYLESLSVPVRAGTHHSTAYALCHAHDYALAVEDDELRQAVERRSRDYFLADARCPTRFEPSGEDFISPCLAEADLMRRVLDREAFEIWLDGFLPGASSPDFSTLLAPPVIEDPEDPRIGHLIGLSFQRAASFEGIALALPPADPRREVFHRLSEIHRDHALGTMDESGYGGAHWLASFAIYLLTGSGPY
jgi:hypothetical protein